MTIDYDLIPSALRAEIIGHILFGEECEGLIAAVLSDSLVRSHTLANRENEAMLPTYAAFLIDFAPSRSWGSAEKVAAWRKARSHGALDPDGMGWPTAAWEQAAIDACILRTKRKVGAAQ